MGEVVDITANQPHMSGPALCLHCGHEWAVVAPVGVAVFECPECDMQKGMFQGLVVPDRAFFCKCGCASFFLLENGSAQCAMCGKEHFSGPDDSIG